MKVGLRLYLLCRFFMCGNSMSSMSSPVIVHPSSKHSATVIFLHGLGDTGHGWSDAMQSIKSSHIKYVCPTAAMMPVTLNAGFQMPSWFDIYALSADGREDEPGIKKASANLVAMIEEEVKSGIPSDRIIVGGFSQGGSVALYSGLTYNKPLAGIIGLSCWLPLHKSFPQALRGNQGMPILQCHGTDDPMVNYAFGEKTSAALKLMVSNHTFKSYPGMSHSSCAQEMTDMKIFIDEILPPQ